MDVTTPDDISAPTEADTAPVPVDRDVANIDASQYPARDLSRLREHRKPGFQAVITRSALNDMHRHGRSSPEVEVCGVLVGNVYRDDHGPYLHVEAVIRGAHAAGRSIGLELSWDAANVLGPLSVAAARASAPPQATTTPRSTTSVTTTTPQGPEGLEWT